MRRIGVDCHCIVERIVAIDILQAKTNVRLGMQRKGRTSDGDANENEDQLTF
jgi:hypothetical protein